MPLIMPIKDLRNTTKISNIAHKEQEPIFITKKYTPYNNHVIVLFLINYYIGAFVWKWMEDFLSPK